MKRGIYLKSCVILVFMLSMALTCSAARTIYVDDNEPADFNTIQAAIDDANDGDTIIVADGTYTGDGNRDIDFLGKVITLRSENGAENCIIDCQGSEAYRHRGFYFHSGEDANSVLDGFTIINGYNEYGGGIRCTESSPHITNCVISDNVAPDSSGFPGGFYTPGGGIYCRDSSTTISNCIISGNQATATGGGVYCRGGSPIINNCNVSDNSSLHYEGGGIYCNEGFMKVHNCILWGNTASWGSQISLSGNIYVNRCAKLTISYSDLQGGQEQIYIANEGGGGCGSVNWGAGNIDIDPVFADAGGGDYHLKSQAGRWYANEGRWTKDEVTSSCIDAGNPSEPIRFEPFPNGGVINMGAYGGTAEASKSYFGQPICETIVAGDINGDCIVNYLDFRLMALNWLRDENL